MSLYFILFFNMPLYIQKVSLKDGDDFFFLVAPHQFSLLARVPWLLCGELPLLPSAHPWWDCLLSGGLVTPIKPMRFPVRNLLIFPNQDTPGKGYIDPWSFPRAFPS